MTEDKMKSVLSELIKGLMVERDTATERHDELVNLLTTHAGLDSYQKAAFNYAVYQDSLYPALALAEEAGEVVGIYAKHLHPAA